jgi:hypothetical protein
MLWKTSRERNSVKGKIKDILYAIAMKIKIYLHNIYTFLKDKWASQLRDGSRDTAQSYKLYWRAYGGAKALMRSPYIVISFFISLAITLFGDINWKWASDAKTIIACTLGFSFAGYSLMLGLADGKFIRYIKGEFPDGKPSPLMVVAASFTHFFITQCVTLVWAITSSAFGLEQLTPVRFIGVFLLIYSICVLLASALAALNFVSWYNSHPEKGNDNGGNS